MSKAIVRLNIPTDYADEYKQWIIEGRLYYLEDGAWTVLKDVQYGVELYKDAIPIEWIRKWNIDNYPYTALLMSEIIPKMLEDWEKENE